MGDVEIVKPRTPRMGYTRCILHNGCCSNNDILIDCYWNCYCEVILIEAVAKLNTISNDLLANAIETKT